MALVPEALLAEEYEQERGKPMPSYNHGIVQANLIFALHIACGDRFTLGSEVALETEPPMTPDIVVYPMRRPDWLHDEVRVAEPPLTAVEILSPSQSVNDLIPKIEHYFAFGTQSVWLVQPPLQQVAVFTSNMEPQVFSHGEVVDSTLRVQIALKEIFS